MQRSLFVAIVGLLSYQAVAESPGVDRCSVKCMRYMKCMENHANGLPDMKTCFQPPPPCNCGPKPVKPESEMCEGGACPKTAPIIDDIIHRCDMVCLSYSKCRSEGSKPCIMPAGCMCPAMPLPESEMCQGGPCPKAAPIVNDIIDRCDSMCMRYSECRMEGSRPCTMPPGCKCSAMPLMAAGAKAMPCLGPQCQPEDDSNMPLHNFCNVQCSMYKQCRGEKNPPMPCIRPSGCMCEESQPMPVEERKSEMLIPPSDRCMEPCKEYWQCRIGGQGGGVHVEKPHLACPRPDGCMCDCMAAGVCDHVDVAKVKSKIIEPVPAAERCPIQYCAQYWNCQVERLGRPDKQLLHCLKPVGCRCECLDEGICLREHFISDQVDLKPMPKPVEGMCSNEKCAGFWMCTWMAMADERLACVKPMGCACDCVAAGICKRGSESDIIPIAPGAQYIWPPPVVPMHEMKCANDCAQFRLCSRLYEADKCKMANDCNCGMLPVRP